MNDEEVTYYPTNAPPKPWLNDDVLYVARGSLDGVYPPVDRAAKVTATIKEDARLANPMEVHLFVMNPDGLFFNHNVPYSGKDRLPGTWWWGWEIDEDGTAGQDA